MIVRFLGICTALVRNTRLREIRAYKKPVWILKAYLKENWLNDYKKKKKEFSYR